jgi:hypothetical protein
MYLLNMVIILCVLYNNVVTAISYIRTYYISTHVSHNRNNAHQLSKFAFKSLV